MKRSSTSWQRPLPAPDGQLATYYVVYRFPRGIPINQGNPKHIIATLRDTSYVDPYVRQVKRTPIW